MKISPGGVSKFRLMVLMLLAMLGQPAKPAFALSTAQALVAHERASKIDHPRFFNGDASGEQILNALRNERADAVNELLGRAGRHIGRPLTAPALLRASPSTKSDPHGAARAVNRLKKELDHLPEFALAWYLTRDARWQTELVRRLTASIIALEAVAERKDLEIVLLRDLVACIAMTLDIGYNAVPTELRSRALRVIAVSVQRARNDVLEDAAKDIPEMRGYHSLAKLCGASLLLAGEFNGSASFVKECLPAYLNRLSPFGGADGGFFHGSSYAVWGGGSWLIVWDIFRRVGGVDPYPLKWVQGFAEFIAYTLPPGAPAGAFGDGAEVRRADEWARFSHELASRVNTPLMRWYAGNQAVNLWGASLLSMLLRPVVNPRQESVSPRELPDSKFFPSVGVAAMHSSLQNRDRVSVLFRSSDFGAIGHAHADQNSFVLTAGDEAVLIDSGVYDWYGSPHWLQWYRQTRAHNAVTYNGGKGQQVGRAAPGTLARNFSDDGRVATVVGDAATAYGPDTRRATRALAFVRPDTILVYDVLAAKDMRIWELNFHTRRPVSVKDAQTMTLRGQREDVCISVVSGPEVAISVEENYAAPPKVPQPKEREMHIRFATSVASTEARFLSLIRFGCDLSLIQWQSRTDGIDVVLDDITISFDEGGGVSYRSK
ncbi:MAG: heparinase II/III family protein [Nitrosospira sp.]|nr:heparinase II/III family protein [Nitrosospira sp.]